MVILAKRKPLSRQQFLALKQRILRKHSPSGSDVKILYHVMIYCVIYTI